jgi:microcystin-dependent protein
MDPFVAEIRIVGFNFAPKGWAFCNGQLISIAQNTALFSLLGTTYGGNGTTNFALPNLQGNAPMHWGQGPGLSNRILGETGGSGSVTLLTTQMPAHNHSVMGSTASSAVTPNGNAWGPLPGITPPPIYQSATPDVPMNPAALGNAGGGQPHNNMQPYLTLNFCIALQGIYPMRID